MSVKTDKISNCMLSSVHTSQNAARLVWNSGLTCSFLASLIFAFSALFVKLTAGRVPVLEVCLIRSSLSVGFSLLLMHFGRLPWRLFFGKTQNVKLLLLRGCCGACGMTLYYVALFLLPLGDAVTINLIGPPVTALFARVLLNEPLGYQGMAGCLVSLIGVTLVAQPPFLFGGHEQWARTRSIGTAAGIASAVLGAGSSMTIRLIGGSEPAAVIAIWFHTATMLLSVAPLLAGVPNKPVLLSPADGGLMLGVAATSFVAQLLGTRGLQCCQAAKAAAMGFTQVVYSNIMGSIFFDDKPTLGSFLGALLILAGVLLVTLRMAGVKRSDAAAPTMHASEARKALAQLCNEEADMDTQALLPVTEKHSDSQLTAAEICQPCHDKGQTAAVALIPPQVCGQLPSVHTPSDGGLVSSLATTGMHETPVEADESSGASVLAQIAASAAAALGGELCPAGSTAVGLQLSRQVSRQLCSSRTVSQMSQQVSQWVSSTPSAFLTAPGLPQEWHRPPRLPSQDVQQLGIDFSSIPGTRHQAADQPLQQPQGLTQALLPSSSATGSPISTEPEQQQQQQHL